MVSFKPLFYSITFMLLIGIIIPGVMSYFIEPGEIPTNSYTSAISDFVEADYTVTILTLSVNLNPFSWLGTTFQQVLSDSVLYMGLYPLWLTVSALILLVLSFVYTVVVIIRGN